MTMIVTRSGKELCTALTVSLAAQAGYYILCLSSLAR